MTDVPSIRAIFALVAALTAAATVAVYVGTDRPPAGPPEPVMVVTPSPPDVIPIRTAPRAQTHPLPPVTQTHPGRWR